MPILGEKLRFNRSNVDLVPDTTGVYALYVDGEIAYYGVAGGRATIRSRLAEHLVGSSRPSRSSAHQFSFEITRYPLSRECALLEEHKRQKWCLPIYNARERPKARGASAIEADEVLQCVVAEIRRPSAARLTDQSTQPQVDELPREPAARTGRAIVPLEVSLAPT